MGIGSGAMNIVGATRQYDATREDINAKQEMIRNQSEVAARQSRKNTLIDNISDSMSIRRSGVRTDVGSELEALSQNAGEREQQALDILLNAEQQRSLLSYQKKVAREQRNIGIVSGTIQIAAAVGKIFSMGQGGEDGKAGLSTSPGGGGPVRPLDSGNPQGVGTSLLGPRRPTDFGRHGGAPSLRRF
jgi:hypothetical protein